MQLFDIDYKTRLELMAGVTAVGITCILGNGLVILSVLRLRHRDVTTHVLPHILIANLALTDLAVGIVYIPAVALLLFYEPGLGKYPCITLYAFITCPVNTSIWGYLVITAEKFISISFPYRKSDWLTERRLTCAAVTTWLIGLIYSTTPYYWSGWKTGGTCAYLQVFSLGFLLYVEPWVFTALPQILISCMYVYIFVVTIRHIRMLRGHGGHVHDVSGGGVASPDTAEISKELKAAGKCFLIIMIYFIMQVIPRIYTAVQSQSARNLNLAIYMWFPLMLNSTINPLLYAFLNQQIRTEMKQILCCGRESRVDSLELSGSTARGQQSQRAEAGIPETSVANGNPGPEVMSRNGGSPSKKCNVIKDEISDNHRSSSSGIVVI